MLGEFLDEHITVKAIAAVIVVLIKVEVSRLVKIADEIHHQFAVVLCVFKIADRLVVDIVSAGPRDGLFYVIGEILIADQEIACFANRKVGGWLDGLQPIPNEDAVPYFQRITIR